MGRALESNFDATFTVDALKLAMIKTEIVAARYGSSASTPSAAFDPHAIAASVHPPE